MRWKYKDGEMIWETPLCTYKVYPMKRDGEILYVLEYSDGEWDLFHERADAKGSAEADYEHRVYNGSRLGEVGDLKAQSLKLVTNFNKYNK